MPDGNASILQYLFKLAWHRIHGANLVKKCLSFCRWSNVFRGCTARTRVVNTPHNSTKPSIISSLVCKNSSWSDPVSVPPWSRLFHSSQNAPNARSIPVSFEFQDSSVGTRLQMNAGCVRPDSQKFVFHRDGIGAVIGLCVPNRSTVCERPLKRTVTLDILSSSLKCSSHVTQLVPNQALLSVLASKRLGTL